MANVLPTSLLVGEDYQIYPGRFFSPGWVNCFYRRQQVEMMTAPEGEQLWVAGSDRSLTRKNLEADGWVIKENVQLFSPWDSSWLN